MRASRLLSILMMLQTRGRVTAEVLAEAFQVSVRPIYPAIAALTAAHRPGFAAPGPGRGFHRPVAPPPPPTGRRPP